MYLKIWYFQGQAHNFRRDWTRDYREKNRTIKTQKGLLQLYRGTTQGTAFIIEGHWSVSTSDEFTTFLLSGSRSAKTCGFTRILIHGKNLTNEAMIQNFIIPKLFIKFQQKNRGGMLKLVFNQLTVTLEGIFWPTSWIRIIIKMKWVLHW